jgi:phosphohistidine phosphatase
MSDVRTLYLLRHLKSSWDDPALPDRDRPLAPRGRRAGRKLARHLRASGAAPELVLCSPSVRTRETLEAILPALGDPEVRFPPELYAAAEEELLDAVRGVEADIGSVLVIAHNPGLQDLTLWLAGSGDEDARRRVGEKLPTGALVTLSFRTDTWPEVEPGSGELTGFVGPRELR